MKTWIPIAFSSLIFSQAFAAEFMVRSPEIKPASTIAQEQVFNGFGCQGGNISPALNWSGAPAGTKSYVFTIPMHRQAVAGGTGWYSIFPLALVAWQKMRVIPKPIYCLQAAFKAAPISASRAMAAPVHLKVTSRIAMCLRCTR